MYNYYVKALDTMDEVALILKLQRHYEDVDETIRINLVESDGIVWGTISVPVDKTAPFVVLSDGWKILEDDEDGEE